MHHQSDCEQKMHIPLILLLMQYISGTQKILSKKNIGKLGQNSPNLGNLLPIFKKETVLIREIRKFTTAGRPAIELNSEL